MPALWQSSERPMYIRTVWVDGFRHAILTHDDPHFQKLCAKRRRPLSSVGFITQKPTRNIRSSLSDNTRSDDVRKLHFVIRNNKIQEPKQETDIELIEKLNLSDVDSSEENFNDSPSQSPLHDLQTLRLKLDSDNMKAVRSNRTARTEVKENTDLSDRVLQWLDLAGKVDLLAPDNAERMTQPRHSWPEIQRRNLTKSKTATELRSKEGKPVVDSKISGNIDPQECYTPTSANTIENYARQSRNVKSTSRHDTKVKENKKVKDMRANIIETRQKMVTERNAVEKQYAELISKKIIPDVNKSRKQVHIFMPEAITKKYGVNSISRTESLLSQIS